MPQSLAQILVHLVFSTKTREPLLADEIRDELHAYIGGIVENQKGTLLKAGSVADHIHLLIAHPRTCAPAGLVQEIKTGSSKWLKTKGARYADFHWQGVSLGCHNAPRWGFELGGTKTRSKNKPTPGCSSRKFQTPSNLLAKHQPHS